MNLALYHYSMLNPLKFIDPDGQWGNLVHHDYTVTWAKDAGLSPLEAEFVGVGDAFIDKVASARNWAPAVGDQSWHFNTNDSGEDSRDVNHRAQFQDAVNVGLQAKGLYQRAEELRAKGLDAQADGAENAGNIKRTESLRLLGMSLHPLQDKDAHKAPYVKTQGRGIFRVWYHDSPDLNKMPALADDINELPERFEHTKSETLRVIREYRRLVDGVENQ